MRVTITGATGGIGSELVAALLARGDQVTVLSRDADAARRTLGDEVEAFSWTAADGPVPPEALVARDGIVNLAGASIAQRWTAAAKRRITESRVATTRALVTGIAELPEDARPRVLVSGSANGYYGNNREPCDESAPQGTGFLAELSGRWEAAALPAGQAGVRVVLLRTGDVLMPGGAGVLGPLTKITRLGLGGPLGGGDQPVPWVHVDDVVGIILLALGNEAAKGPINAVAPGIVSQRELSKALGSQLGRPAIVPAPGFAVRLIVGEMADLILEGANLKPAAATSLGYRFAFPGIAGALDDIFSR